MIVDLLTAAIEDYLMALESEGRARATIRIYGIALRRFSAYAGPIAPAQCTPALLRAWLKGMADDGLSIISQRGYLRSVQTWLAWLAEEESYGLTRQQQRQCRGRVKPPPPVTEQIRPFTDEEIVALFAECNPRGWMGLRTRAILALLLDTGLRASELYGLTIADVDLATGDIHVRAVTSKVRRSRSIALGRRAKRDMGHWWARKRHLLDSSEGARWFCTGEATPLKPRSLLHIVSRLGASAGVKECYPHKFRHTAAIEGLRAGMTPFAIMRMLGHSDLTMTRRYMRYLDQDMNEEKRAKSPLDHLRVQRGA